MAETTLCSHKARNWDSPPVLSTLRPALPRVRGPHNETCGFAWYHALCTDHLRRMFEEVPPPCPTALMPEAIYYIPDVPPDALQPGKRIPDDGLATRLADRFHSIAACWRIWHNTSFVAVSVLSMQSAAPTIP